MGQKASFAHAVGGVPCCCGRNAGQLVSGGRSLPGRDGFVVMAWNVLADGTAQDEYQQRHGGVDEGVAGWNARKLLLAAEVARVQPDILLLCECNHFEDFWSEELQALGLKGLWAPKFDSAAGGLPFRKYIRDAPSDGCAIFYRQECLKEVWTETFRFQNTMELAKQVLLEPINLEGPRLLVGVTHLKGNNASLSADLRRMQAGMWAKMIKQTLSHAGAGELDNVEIVLAGDMNEPLEPTDNFEHVGGAVRILQEELGVHSAYAGSEPEVTATWGRNWWSATDFILHSEGLCPEARLTMPTVEQLYQNEPDGLPSKNYPSDHIALAVRLSPA